MRQIIITALLLHYALLAETDDMTTTGTPAWTTARPSTAATTPAWTTARPSTAATTPAWTTARPSTAATTPAWTTARPPTSTYYPWTTTRPHTSTYYPWTTTRPPTTTYYPWTTTPYYPNIYYVEANIENSAYTFLTVDEYDKISLYCQVSGSQNNQYTWERRDYGNPKWHLFEEGQHITFTAYVGVYRCTAKNYYQQVVSRNEIAIDIACLDSNDKSA